MKTAVELAATGVQPMYEEPGHHVAFPLILRMAEALNVSKPPAAVEIDGGAVDGEQRFTHRTARRARADLHRCAGFCCCTAAMHTRNVGTDTGAAERAVL